MALRKTIDDREYRKFVESLTRPDHTAIETFVGNSAPISGLDYDTITATYPTTSSEVYTYTLLAATIQVVTVTYTDDTKKILTSVVYS